MENKITIYGGANDEIIEREMTQEELAEAKELIKQGELEQAAKEAAREATIAKLAALGLTPEDLAAL